MYLTTSYLQQARRVWLLATTLVTLALILLGVSTSVLAEQSAAEDASVSAVRVTTAIAASGEWPLTVKAQGEILPWEVAMLSNKTTGIATEQVNVVEGDKVTKGEVLARFDQRQLTADVAKAKADVALAEANYQLAQSNLKRFDQLQVQQALSEQDLQSAQTQLATAAASKQQAQAALQIAQIKLSDASVIAPDNGQILQRNVEQGQIPAAGQRLFSMLRQGKLEWIAQFDASQLPQIKTGMPVQISDNNQRHFSGKIRSVSPELNSSSKLASVRVLLDGEPQLAVNSYVEGNILLGQMQAVFVPADCVVIKDGRTWLFRVNNDVAEQVAVRLGRRQQQAVEILRGIKPGDQIVQQGAGFLNHGDKVQVVQAAQFNAGAMQ